jgi:hypothetical protein
VPPQLSALNYIFFYAEPRLPGSGFGTGLARLASALDTDLDWLREHTRLLQRASEWDSAGRTESRLLFRDSIAEAKAWVARRPKDAPEPTALQYDFVRASEEAEARRQDAERQQLAQIAAAQADRAKALAQREEAQEREAEQACRVVRRTLIGMAVAIALFLGTAALAVGLVGASVDANERSEAANSAAREAAQQTARGQAFVTRLENERGRRFEAALATLSAMVLPFKNDEHLSQSDLYDELVWAYSADRFLVSPLRHADSVMTASFDPKGELVVTGSADNSARIWDAHTGEPIGKPLQHGGGVPAVCFDLTGERIVTASDDESARIWDAHTGEPISEPFRHLRTTKDMFFTNVTDAEFDPKGERVVTASADGTARIWDARTGEPIGKPLQHANWVRTAMFAPAGEHVVTPSERRRRARRQARRPRSTLRLGMRRRCLLHARERARHRGRISHPGSVGGVEQLLLSLDPRLAAGLSRGARARHRFSPSRDRCALQPRFCCASPLLWGRRRAH